MELGKDRVFTISELNERIRSLIKTEFPQYIWVCGEIFRIQDKGHVYIDIVQKQPQTNQVLAQATAIIFNNIKFRIEKKLKEADAEFKLKEGIEVKFLCEVDYYTKGSRLSLRIFDIDPVYTLGRIAQLRQKIIEDLAAKGLIEKNRLLEIPPLPLKIGLITSFDSAAYHDFLNELHASDIGFEVFLFNSTMQGKKVEGEVVRAINYFNQSKKADIIILTRGGGSTADLSWFDNKNIALAIANSTLPVISALGHQINLTVADLVAHTHLKTPTKAAQFVIDMVTQFFHEVDLAAEGIFSRAEDYFNREKNILENQTIRLGSFVHLFFSRQKENLSKASSNISSSAEAIINFSLKHIEEVGRILKLQVKNIFHSLKVRLAHSQEKIKMLSPKNILKRGYSITIDKNGRTLKDIAYLEEGESIRTLLYQGEIYSKVTKKDAKGGLR